MQSVKDYIIRKIATSFLLKWTDGKKTEIMRAVQAFNMLLLACAQFCSLIPDIKGINMCALVGQVQGQWLALGVLLGHLGLEFGIQDANAKDRALLSK